MKLGKNKVKYVLEQTSGVYDMRSVASHGWYSDAA